MTMSVRQRTLVHRSAALLLEYPDEDLLSRLPSLRAATAGLDEPFRGLLGRIIGHLERTPVRELAAHHAATFAGERRSCPCAALEFAADADPATATRMLIDDRVGLEQLRRVLTGAGSPYADPVAAVSLTLPRLDDPDRHAVEARSRGRSTR